MPTPWDYYEVCTFVQCQVLGSIRFTWVLCICVFVKLVICSSNFLVCCDIIPNESNLRKAFISGHTLKVLLSVLVGKAWRQEWRVTLLSQSRSRVGNAVTQLHSSVTVSSNPQSLESCRSQLGWIFWSRNSRTISKTHFCGYFKSRWVNS